MAKMAFLSGLTSVLISFGLCQLFGRYSESLIFFAITALVSNWVLPLRTASALGFVSTLSYAFMTSQSEGLWATVAPPLSLFITRISFRDECAKGSVYLSAICLISAMFISSLSDRDWICFLLSISAVSIPLYPTKVLQWNGNASRKHEWMIVLIMCTVIPMVILLSKSSRLSGKTAVVTGSSWAKFEKKLDHLSLDAIDISYMYSYSELQQLLQADTVTLEEVATGSPILDNYEEIWMITPTMTITNAQADRLLEWVNEGGKLIIITDHTDLFGHATVLNQVLNKIGLNTACDAFFPVDPFEMAQTSMNFNYSLKTANTQSGTLLWPVMTARWVSELADYSNRNFFGPMRATGTAKYGRRVIAGGHAHGNGQIILFGDSTIFANFAIYQPGYIDFIEFLRSSKVMPALYRYFALLVLLGWLICFLFKQNRTLCLLPLVGLWSLFDIHISSVVWPEHIICSGDADSVSELTEPKGSFSTAYSLISLSGKRPKWVNDPNSVEAGLWFGESSPPSNQWKWISTQSKSNEIDLNVPLDDLLSYLTSANPSSDFPSNSETVLKAGRIWTNDCMGEWWLDHGISHPKKRRFSKWLQAISNYPKVSSDVSSNVVDLEHEHKFYKLKYGDEDWITVSLPEIKYQGKCEIYLGRGVSAKVVNLNGKEVLIGTRSLTEGWTVPSSWILIPYEE